MKPKYFSRYNKPVSEPSYTEGEVAKQMHLTLEQLMQTNKQSIFTYNDADLKMTTTENNDAKK